MDEIYAANRAELCGVAVEPPMLSHESRGIRFYTFPLETVRLSGAADRLNVVVRESMLSSLPETGGRVQITGELRSFNNRTGSGSRLVLTVYARELSAGDGPDENRILLTGAICKTPNYRVTPMGREICDIILAVGRRYRRSDYIPIIAWGAQARETSVYPIGTQLSLRGRLQSREYTKMIDGMSVQRTAFEVSAADILPL